MQDIEGGIATTQTLALANAHSRHYAFQLLIGEIVEVT